MKTKILIVEDDDQSLHLLTGVLEQQGYHIIQAHDGYEGLEAARQTKPALILLDILLPQMDGYVVAHTLRQDAAFACVPILAVSAVPMMSNQSRALEAGCTDYIEKPFDLGYLISKVKEHLQSDCEQDEAD